MFIPDLDTTRSNIEDVTNPDGNPLEEKDDPPVHHYHERDQSKIIPQLPCCVLPLAMVSLMVLMGLGIAVVSPSCTFRQRGEHDSWHDYYVLHSTFRPHSRLFVHQFPLLLLLLLL